MIQPSPTSTYFRFRIIVAILFILIVGSCSFFPFGGFEGRATATTRFADGTPAPCIKVGFRPLVIKGPENPRQVQGRLLLGTTSGEGWWSSGGTWPYGEYQITASASPGVPVARSTFTIWPMITTHVELIIDNKYKPDPLPKFPDGCLEALELVAQDQ